MPKFDWNQYPAEGSMPAPQANSAPSAAAASSSPQGGGKKFDWGQYPVEGQESKDQDLGVNPQAALQGFGQFATSGYLPELTGAVGKLVPDPSADVNAKLRAQGVKISEPEFHGMSTDESRAMQKQMAADSPGSYYAGGAAGAIASAPAYGAALKGVGIAKDVAPMAELATNASIGTKAGAYASNLGARMVQSGKEGLALGFASNPNSNQGDEGFNAGKRVFNAGTTGVVSGAIPVAGDTIKGAWNAGKAASKWAGTKLLSSLGGVNPNTIREYAQFSDRINAAPSVDALKQVSDDFVGKLSSDVEAKKITADQAQDAFKAFQSDVKDTFRSAAYDARDSVTSAQQTLKDAHGARLQQLSGDVYDTINQLKSDVQKGSGAALKTLDKSDAMIDLGPTHDAIDTTIGKLEKSGTDEAIAISGKLQAYKDRLATKFEDGVVPAPDAKKLIQGLDQITTYSPMAGSFDQAKNAAFKTIRSSLDQTLKDSVPEYKAQMGSVSSDTDLLNRVSDFGDKQTGVGLLGRIQAPNQMERRTALQELGQKYGTDFVGAANPKNLPEHTILGRAQAAQEALRPDRVADKMDQTLAASRQQAAVNSAQAGLTEAQQKLAPFKPLAPNAAGQTQAQQKLMQLASGKNIELEGMFTQLGKMTDTDFVQAMKDRNIQAAFQKGAYNGSRNTLMGALAGFIMGGAGGAAAGGAAGRVVDQWGPALTKQILDGAIKVSKSPTVQTIQSLSLPQPLKDSMATGLKNYLAQTRPFQGTGPLSGQPLSANDRWAQQGTQKLGLDPEVASRMLADPKGKQLLIQASDLTPGSKAMTTIRNQIEKGWGK